MGSKKVVKKLRQKGIALFFSGILLLMATLLMFYGLLKEGAGAVIVLPIAFFVGSIALVYFGIDYMRGRKSRYAKKNPEVFDLADDLDANPVYEDKFIVVSNKAIAAKKDFSTAANLNDILAIYESINRTNGIVTSHVVKLELINGRTISINVYARKRETKDNVVLTISHYCPNAAVGYSGEIMSYVRAKRKEYKNAMRKQ